MANHQEPSVIDNNEDFRDESEKARYETEAGLGEVFYSVDDLMNHLNA